MIYRKAIGARITQVPRDVEDLFEMCKAAGIEYRGKGAGAVARSVFFRSLKKPRRCITFAGKEQVRIRQDDRCECGEKLDDSAELEHITPREVQQRQRRQLRI